MEPSAAVCLLTPIEAKMVIRWLETEGPETPRDPPKQRAAEYVRMSTEHQQYSTDNQSSAIRRYTNLH